MHMVALELRGAPFVGGNGIHFLGNCRSSFTSVVNVMRNEEGEKSLGASLSQRIPTPLPCVSSADIGEGAFVRFGIG